MNDNQENNFFKSITSIVHKHAVLLTVMSQGLQCTMSVALNARHKCSNSDCEKIATWQKDLGNYACDRHVAIDTILSMGVFDESWQEIADSDQIRELEEFISLKEQMGIRHTVH